MDINDITTSREATSELKARCTKLESLRSVADDAMWLASRDERELLESDVRTLEQLVVRLKAREEQQEKEVLLEEIATQEKRRGASGEPLKKLQELVLSTAKQAILLLREHDAALREVRDAERRIWNARNRLGQNQSAAMPMSYELSFNGIQRALWQLLKAERAQGEGRELIELFTAQMDPADSYWAFAVERKPEPPLLPPPEPVERPCVFEKPRGNVFIHADVLDGTFAKKLQEEEERKALEGAVLVNSRTGNEIVESSEVAR